MVRPIQQWHNPSAWEDAVKHALADVVVTKQQTAAHHPQQLRHPGDGEATKSTTTTQGQQQQRQNQERPNIVLFYADDWTARILGKLNPHVHTPHIDAMADNGVLFSHNCVTTSICWISRASLVTGMYAGKHRHMKPFSDAMFDEVVPWNETLYPQLKHAGYHTGFVGKWHANQPRELLAQAWDHSLLYFGHHWMQRNGTVRHVTELNRHDALHYLRHVRPRSSGNGAQQQPFALTVSFFATHAEDGQDYPDQYQPQNWSKSLYDGANGTIPLAKTATDQHWRDMPWFFDERNEGRQRWRKRYPTADHYQDTMVKTFRMATEVDEACGAIVAELKRQGVYNNTILVFTSDNGNFHGEHGLADKWYPHEESIRVPLVIQDPRLPPEARGVVVDEMTLSIDVAPTLLSAAGIPVPAGMQGRDMADLYLRRPPPGDRDRAWRQDFFYEWTQGDPITSENHTFGHIPAVFALVRKDYKYFYWPAAQYEQLFHVADDPWEEFDVYNSTAQTNGKLLATIKRRYAYLKRRSQSGGKV